MWCRNLRLSSPATDRRSLKITRIYFDMSWAITSHQLVFWQKEMLILGEFGQMIKTKTPLNQFAANMLPFAYLNVHFDPDIWSCHGCRIWTDPTVPSLQWQGGEKTYVRKTSYKECLKNYPVIPCWWSLVMIVMSLAWDDLLFRVSCVIFLKFQLVRKALDPQKTFARSKNPFCHTELEMCLFIFSQYFTMLQPFECNA